MSDLAALAQFTLFTTKFRDHLDKLMKEIGINGGQIFILRLLWQTDGLSQSEMVKTLSLSAPTVYNMVIRLAETGYVTINKDKLDARMMRVKLTEKGRSIESQANQQLEILESRIFQNLTESEKLMMRILLEKVIDRQKI